MPDKQDASRRRVADAQSPGRRFGEIRLRIAGLFGAAGVLAILMLAGAPAASASAAECSNEAIRAEQSSTYLANCRAYEQVMPAQKDSAEPVLGLQKDTAMFEPMRGVLAAQDGSRLTWVSRSPGLSGPNSDSLGLQYLSTRHSGGWVTEATVPRQSPETGLACPEYLGIVGWSRNFSKGVLADGASQEYPPSGNEPTFANTTSGCGHAEPALREADGAEIEEPAGFQNLFLRNNEAGFYQLVNVTPSGEPTPTPAYNFQTYFEPNYLAGSAHLALVAFEDELPLTEQAEKLSPEIEAACGEEPKGRACWEGHDDLYVWSEGRQPAVRLVTILPGGEPVEGRLAGATRILSSEPLNIADYRHAVSEDGSRIFFEAEGSLYVRENASQPQSALNGTGECTEPEKGCTIKLDASQGGGGSGGATWLGANVQGTKVFFTDAEQLTSTSVAGSGANLYEYDLPSEADKTGTLVDLTKGAAEAGVLGVSGISNNGSYVYFAARGELVAGKGTAGAPNLYLSHEGTITFIATLNTEDECDWTSDTRCRAYGSSLVFGESGLTARISGNGSYLAFNSINQLTASSNETNPEIYLYEANASNIACVSCKPNGEAPSSDGAVIDWPSVVDISKGRNAYPQHNVSEAGQVFFETSEELLPQDKNGVRDVYEYGHGTLSLISSGTSTAPSYFLDASTNGTDVFFATSQKLERWDTDSAYDIYDAREGGGFREPPSPAEPCAGEAGCKPAAAATPLLSAPGSATFVGQSKVVSAKTLKNTGAKAKPPSRRQKLRQALKMCADRHMHHRRARRKCSRDAHTRFSRNARSRRHRRHHRNHKRSRFGTHSRRGRRGGRP